ncbi:hypothetical protein, partial [Flavobacterium sp.]|uniref:hypothetical protein n=1 Tax=Flavobacterium sp. TaxID=239 RepID=UPI004048CEF9
LDLSLLNGGYFWMIGNTLSESFLLEFSVYLKSLKLENLLFGLKPGSSDDPFPHNELSGAIPVTDVGLVGIPLQHGLLGLIQFFYLLYIWHRVGSVNFKHFIIINLFSIIHYFPIISFPGVVIGSWLAFTRSQTFESKENMSNRNKIKIEKIYKGRLEVK